MVNVTVTTNENPERALALSYAPADRCAALAALFALDATLGQVLRTTREPMVGQMRLAWWREALERLDSAPPPGEPVLQALAAEVLPLGVTGQSLAAMVDGWEPLLLASDDAALFDHGALRGSSLFQAAGRLVGADANDPLASAGHAWALADLAQNLRDQDAACRAMDEAKAGLAAAGKARWSRNGRALGALAHIARLSLAGPARPSRVIRLAWHRLTGR